MVTAKSTLIAEVERYLKVVEFFRAEGCELHWTAELVSAESEPVVPPTAPRTFAGPG